MKRNGPMTEKINPLEKLHFDTVVVCQKRCIREDRPVFHQFHPRQ